MERLAQDTHTIEIEKIFYNEWSFSAEIWNIYATGISRLILTLTRLGFGRGRLKLLFAKVWKQLNGDQSVDLPYFGVKFRLKPSHNTIESKDNV